MPCVSSSACSCGFVHNCRSSDNRAEGSFAERSVASDNYRGEWLGCIGALQVLLAVISTTDINLDSISSVHAHTDNIGVVTHNRHLHWTLSDTQPQGDLIRVGKEYRRRIPFCVTIIMLLGTWTWIGYCVGINLHVSSRRIAIWMYLRNQPSYKR